MDLGGNMYETKNNKYPDLKDSKIICFDIETYDPELTTKGTGVYRKDGNILGCAVSNGEFSSYYNIGHKNITTEEKMRNITYLREVLGSQIPKLATNILYDSDWLQNGYDIKINGEMNDIQIAEPLICEYRPSFSLDNQSKFYLQKEKFKTEIDEFCTQHNLSGGSRKWLYLMPFETVEKYAVPDAMLPIQIFEKQLKILQEENLIDVYKMEIGLIPLLLQMKKVGVRLDVKKVNEKIEQLEKKIDSNQIELDNLCGRKINVKSPKDKQYILDKLGIEYERATPTKIMQSKGIEEGNPILDKPFLKTIDNPIIKKLLEISEFRTILATFFTNSFTEMRVKDRLHCNFNPLKSDEYGTVSGRFSSSNPNLQQIPGKEETMGDFCREVFIPEEGMLWGKLDWSQIEYRLIAHYAVGEGAEKIRRQYQENPDTDYHQYIMDLTGLERKNAKIMNFGLAYFMGVFSLSKKFGWSLEEAKNLVDTYHKHVPFLKSTRTNVVNVAKSRGYLRTLLGRRARISPMMIMEHKEYSIFNRLIQGSAADLMKKAMLDSYKAGIYNTLIPHLTVHDELDFSIPQTRAGIEATRELKNIMENCIKLRVPIIADLEIGDNWGNVSEERAIGFIGEKI
jgi:DNA polymerase I-like protein with 3'-5' exonuclease and polymerase domains